MISLSCGCAQSASRPYDLDPGSWLVSQLADQGGTETSALIAIENVLGRWHSLSV